jgi:Kef-type K+ transport system membrane component KefB/voltage-gated potassium channel Kch
VPYPSAPLVAVEAPAGSGLELGPLLLVLVVAWGAGRAASRVGYPPVLGEILAGIALGPPLLGLLSDARGLDVVGELGVTLMMLYIGTEIDTDDLRRASRVGLLAAVGGFVVPAGLGFVVTLWFGGTVIAASFVAIAVGVTSLATKSRILVDLDLLDTRIAYVMMAGALLADTATLVLFAAILGFVEVGGFDLVGTGQVAAEAVAFFAVAGVVGVRLLPRLAALVKRATPDDRILRFIFVIGVGLAYAELAEIAGLHAVLGAFVGGVFLRRTVLEDRSFREVNRTVHDLSIGFLAPVFFVTAGFETSLEVFRTDLVFLLAVVGVAVVGKLVGTALFYLPSGHGWREGITVGAGMNGRGAVEIIVAGIGLERGLISAEIFTILVFMAVATTAMVPVLLKWCVEWLRSRGELAPSGQRRSGAVIVGCGPVARYLAHRLAESGQVRLVDSNPDRCATARRDGLAAITGDALEEETLRRAGASTARQLIALTANSEVNLLAAQLAHDAFLVPERYVAARTSREPGSGSLLDRVDAEPMFDAPVDTSLWDRWLETGEAGPVTVAVSSSEDPASLRDLLRGGRNAYPLTVERDGQHLPFVSVDELLTTDRVHVLRRQRDGDASGATPPRPVVPTS